MAHRELAAAVAAVLCTAPLGARAADQLRPLRTLTYAVDVSVSNVLDTAGGGISSGARPVVITKGRTVGQRGSPAASGSGDKRDTRSATTRGTITVDVLAATDDEGLVVEISEDATPRARPKMRIAIAADGVVYYDPSKSDNVSEEEYAVLHWLARGFYGDRPTDPGTSWTVDLSANGHTDVERYRVLSREEQSVTLDYALDERSAGARGYAGSREGSLVYDTAMIVPVKAAFATIAHRQVGQVFDTLRTSVKLTLTADSFAKRTSSR